MNGIVNIARRQASSSGGGAELVLPNLYVNLDASDASSYPGTGTTWFDLSGNSNDFTLYNGVSYSAVEGGQLVCDGVNDYMQSTNTVNETTAAFSAFAYVKCSDLTQGAFAGAYLQNVMSKRPATGAATSYYQFIFQVTFADWVTYTYSQPKSILFDGAGSVDTADEGSPPITYSISNDQWVYVGFTTDGTNGGEHNIFMNGTKVATTTLPFDRNVGNNYIRLMSEGFGTAYAMEGSIRNVHMYTRKLSEAEVAQNYNAISL
jgi:hypothetical protein